jgi:hypothetical protein
MKFTKREIKSNSGGGSSMFLKFQDGESKTGVLRGDVYEFYQVWEDGQSKIVEPSHPDGKARFRANLVVQEDGKFVAKIFEFGLTVYNQLADISDEYDIEKTKIKITRRGVKTDTTWMILPLLKEPLGAKALAEIEAVPLQNLEHKQKVLIEPGYVLGADEDDNAPF